MQAEYLAAEYQAEGLRLQQQLTACTVEHDRLHADMIRYINKFVGTWKMLLCEMCVCQEHLRCQPSLCTALCHPAPVEYFGKLYQTPQLKGLLYFGLQGIVHPLSGGKDTERT